MSRQTDQQSAQTTEHDATTTKREPSRTDDGIPAIIAKRSSETPVETEEIRALASAAGYRVIDEVTQVRREDPGTHFGSGKVDSLSDRIEATDASVLVIDGGLTPSQTTNLRDCLPDETEIFDRYRLVLSIFAAQAGTRRAQLQVELAQLKYALPRIETESDPQAMNIALEKGTRVKGVRDRIAELESKLADLPNPAAQYRSRRREQGFDLVTVAGYTNAGKSTLLHRLADDLSLDSTERHPDEANSVAAVEDRLFKTLQTTTRRATLEGRPVLATDTVGFVDDLPHWLVESFSTTISEAAAADIVVLVADASDDVETLREKIRVSLSVFDAQGVETQNVVTALNKTDLLTDAECESRVAAAESLAPRVVPVSVVEETNLETLVEVVCDRLPTATETVSMSTGDEAMSVVSWAYDHARVESVEYGAETVTLTLQGRPEILERMRGKVESVGESDPG
ncbi:GTP-binding proten HflX [Halogeometricum borinquense DSM 11551]|uniref:GTP-binding protein HflX n=1 Tax=Halogeometricum borinquense (strain ATCC 700274 / DSM 11551 / JCM 10706 / KCTC 4070 / PR3) TaxID=469382 RepID=E4NP09_HALBP|nr:GTPase HflX [Halogeometricum borinquense]ADQ66440.1 GTP-binding protein HflX [Halogeometricum borinquense DSM 11551]ELY31160.1 GTP-binding proten HflX [Halogeometricum borinquense DSM 11551]